jgi:hypothetical protein
MEQTDWLDQTAGLLAFSLLISSFVLIAILVWKQAWSRRDRP